ncbi:LacI family transcriptional regulator [Sphaerotilus sulfidivorans]|uniref:LacI family DNA-binding transcriptional regulator n=1 Tax=Sphaerotilus sulfidivorans TaxID=639200 RepID=A0A5C1Q2X5_9BURK|nr:substrate-binding domain-containing protein [Sphaerotilus sulfidivorans]NZD45119.1 substrate-binding domain-containing protein [Sphaerotilus sulfidivorans]QEN02385.1 LacI family DNA-binding transcriptional regulator [Sphaerotilus sulfidivorans]
MDTKEELLCARATLQDVAREAQVGIATVDRVLNKRPGVHARTVERVEQAARRLGYRPDPAAARLARQRVHRVRIVLPGGTNPFVALLRTRIEASQPWLTDRRAVCEVVQADTFSPEALATCLRQQPAHCEALIVMGVDHPLVRAALDDLVDQGVTVITLVSDVPTSRRAHFVGIDNVAAGRTAAGLLGRFLPRPEAVVGVIAGSLSLRDHAERWLGFKQVMEAEHGAVRLLAPLEGRDDARRNQELVARLLDEQPALDAIYSLGAGNEGISAALRQSGRARSVRWVCHELTTGARADLLDCTLDAVINQDAAHEIRSALRLALAAFTREPIVPDQERIRIDIYMRDNLP